VERDADEELSLSDELRRTHSREQLEELASRHAMATASRISGWGAVWRALTSTFGHGVRIGRAAMATIPRRSRSVTACSSASRRSSRAVLTAAA